MNDESRQDWFGDAGSGEPPTTDEFGRTDDDSIERERRRQERIARRASRRDANAQKRGRKRKPRDEPAERPEPTGPPVEFSGAPPPAGERPQSSHLGERIGDAAGALRERIDRARASREGRGRGGPRGGGRGQGAPASSFGRRRIAAAAAGVVALLLVWFLFAFFQPFAGDGEGEVVVQIPEGASATKVADVLSEADVVSNGTLFKWRLQLSGKSGEILPGRHVLAADMSYGSAIDRLTSEQSDGLVTVTIPEGLPRSEAAPIVSDAGVRGDYVQATESFQGFDPGRYGAKNPPSLEGFLFPATYELEPGAPVDELVGEQLTAFEQNFSQVNMKFAKSKNLTPYDVLIIASMVDREVQVPRERRLVAAVIYNRLSQGIPLGIDATTRYEYDIYDEQLTDQQLNADTPYNTRINAGLPPTPIGNPGVAAIEAAASPAKSNFLYFVVKPYTCGEHSFTASEKEFEQLVADYQAALEKEGGAPTTCPDGAE